MYFSGVSYCVESVRIHFSGESYRVESVRVESVRRHHIRQLRFKRFFFKAHYVDHCEWCAAAPHHRSAIRALRVWFPWAVCPPDTPSCSSLLLSLPLPLSLSLSLSSPVPHGTILSVAREVADGPLSTVKRGVDPDVVVCLHTGNTAPQSEGIAARRQSR